MDDRQDSKEWVGFGLGWGISNVIPSVISSQSAAKMLFSEIQNGAGISSAWVFRTGVKE